jgi:hypothetical protein
MHSKGNAARLGASRPELVAALAGGGAGFCGRVSGRRARAVGLAGGGAAGSGYYFADDLA